MSERRKTMRILHNRIEIVNLCWAAPLGTAFPLSADLPFKNIKNRQTWGDGNQLPTIFICPINLFLNSLPFKIPWWSMPSYGLLSTTIHAWRYIYPNSVIGTAPSAGGSVTGPPPGLQPGEIPNHPEIPRTKTRQRKRERGTPFSNIYFTPANRSTRGKCVCVCLSGTSSKNNKSKQLTVQKWTNNTKYDSTQHVNCYFIQKNTA